MIKRTVNFTFRNYNFLNYINIYHLEEYATKYIGDLISNKPQEKAIMFIKDKKLGTIIKITYIEQQEFELAPITRHAYIGEFGHLYKSKKGFNYFPITQIETQNFYGFMRKELSAKLLHEYNKEFKRTHIKALKTYRLHLNRVIKERFEYSSKVKKESYMQTLKDFKAASLEDYFEEKTK